MDVLSLVAVHLPRERRATKMSSSGEDRYYRDQIMLRRESVRMLGSIAARVHRILLAVRSRREAPPYPANQRAILHEPLQRGTAKWTSARLRGPLFWR